MTLPEIWPWLESFTNLEKVPAQMPRVWRLDRMTALTKALGLADDTGAPALPKPVFHLAGSKGKGSTAAFLASILHQAGLKPGLFTSPHLSDWRERITLAGEFFASESYESAFSRLQAFDTDLGDSGKKDFAQHWGGPPTTFELLTLGAFLIFQKHCGSTVLETGLGGRLDATNVCRPQVCVLTLIEYEHTEILGSTLTQIAGEKAGILKPGVPVIVTPQNPEAQAVFQARAHELGLRLWNFSTEVSSLETELFPGGTRLAVRLKQGTEWSACLPVWGQHQAQNAVAAALAFWVWAQEYAPELPVSSLIEAGWANTSLPGRMEIVSQDPLIVIDGAHTEQSALAAAQTWQQVGTRDATLLFGAFDGKNLEGMTKALAGVCSRVIVCPPGPERPSSIDAMAEAFRRAGVSSSHLEKFADAEQAWQTLSARGGPVLVTGSFYLAGKVRRWIKNQAST
ncbi:MAG: hypothetical protein HKM05_00635 [Spirochaetales bacterium]|nr:hypothetical protein [Spirochaetales bacterium]